MEILWVDVVSKLKLRMIFVNTLTLGVGTKNNVLNINKPWIWSFCCYGYILKWMSSKYYFVDHMLIKYVALGFPNKLRVQLYHLLRVILTTSHTTWLHMKPYHDVRVILFKLLHSLIPRSLPSTFTDMMRWVPQREQHVLLVGSSYSTSTSTWCQ